MRTLHSQVHAWVLRGGAALLFCLWLMLQYAERAPKGPHPSLATAIAYSTFYVCEDLTTLICMMQNGAVAQEIFTATEARRVVGLVQLGSSVGAVIAGLSAGWISELGGAPTLVLACSGADIPRRASR